MARPDAATLRADPKAAAELPADDPGVDEHLHAAPQYPRLLRLRAGRAAAAGPTAATGLSADGAGVDEHLHADVQHPLLLRPGRDEACSGGHATNPTGEIKKTKGEAPSSLLSHPY